MIIKGIHKNKNIYNNYGEVQESDKKKVETFLVPLVKPVRSRSSCHESGFVRHANTNGSVSAIGPVALLIRSSIQQPTESLSSLLCPSRSSPRSAARAQASPLSSVSSLSPKSFWSHSTTSNCQLCTSAVVRSVSPSEPGMLLLLYVVSCKLLVHLTAPVVHHHQPGFHVNDWSGKPYP